MSEVRDICEETRARFSALIEDDLSPALRRATEAHLAECADCRTARARFEQMVGALGRLLSPEPPADLPARIDSAVDRLAKSPRPRSRARFARPAVAALLVAGIVVGIIRVVPELRGPLPVERVQPLEQAEQEKAPADAFRALDADEARARREEPVSRAVEKSKRAADMREGAAVRAPAVGRVAGEETASPRSLLLSARRDAAWVAAIRDLALARAGDLAAAWETLSRQERARVLEAWRSAPPVADLRRDLARARGSAEGDRERRVVETLLGAAPESSP